MSAELDMSQYLDLFLQEAGEQLEILEQETLNLEDDPSVERLQLIFRAAHTIKGSSRAMGFANYAGLTHEMENLLDQLRNGVLKVCTEITDALLQCIDTLKSMSEGIAAGTGDQVECGPLILALQKISTGSAAVNAPPAGSGSLTEEQLETLKLAKSTGSLFHGVFDLAPDCVMKYVRAFMAISAIQAHGEIVLAVPNEDELEAEEFGDRFEVWFQYADDLNALTEHIRGISEVASASIGEYDFAPAPTVMLLAAEPAVPAEAPKPEAKKTETNQTVRVDVARLDALMNLVGELVIDRTRIAQIGNELAGKYHDANIDALSETVGHIARITTDLQEQIMKARMLPIDTVFNRFPRVVRDLAQKLGKEIKLELVGKETELDRSVIEVIGDPLLHILRNCVDHGVEMPEFRSAAGKPATGTITVSARHQENHIVIEIRDDGAGINLARVKEKAVANGMMTKDAADKMPDKEAFQLIFASGLSTAQQVSDVSGRGVGMDIVRSNIVKLGGIIDIDSEVGKGSKFTLRLPLTLAIIRGLLVDICASTYVIPLGSVVETLFLDSNEFQRVNNKPVTVIRGATTPLVDLTKKFSPSKKNSKDSSESSYAVIVGLAEQRIGLLVDELIGEQEVVIKSLSRHCGEAPGVSGATILGDGNVAMILDVSALLAS
ncbi:MAG: chemotaxis protein CheA [Chthonomonas sp.]|nr:chemotaxis protein CheA [Chthonomonas sp.]